jgi:hypothetical protein
VNVFDSNTGGVVVECIQSWPGNPRVKCDKKPAWNAALTEGRMYRIVEYSVLNTQVKVVNDKGKKAWYNPSAFRQRGKRLFNDREQS